MRDWAALLIPRLAPLHLSPGREAEIVEELSQHLEQRYEEFRMTGASESAATALAIEELATPDTLARRMRPLRQANVSAPVTPGSPRRALLGDLAQDLRYAARVLRQQPGFAAAAILTLALGIGANSAIFALADATLLRPLPLPDPDRLVVVSERTQASSRERVSPPDLLDWSERNRTFDRLAGFMPNVGGMVMGGADGTADTVPRQWVTFAFFDVLGVKPVAGRTFRSSDDRQRAKVAVLSEAFWRSRFNGDPGVVGREIRLDGAAYTVVGVAPNEVRLLGRTSIWAMVPVYGAPASARRAYIFQAIGRIKSGQSIQAADADLEAIAAALGQEFPATNKGRSVTVERLDDVMIGSDLRRTSMLFLGVVGFVLLICCANVANLLVARATARTRELAIRSTLGADRSRVIRQLLTESVVLALIGGTLGALVGAAILAVAPSVIPEGLLPAAVTPTFDLRVAAFCGAASLLVGLMFGIAPAWHAAGFSAAALASGSRTTTGRGGRLRAALVAAEVATAVVLLFGASLLLRTLLAVERVDRGYRAESVLTLMVDPLGARYPTPESLLQFFDTIEQQVRAVPGVAGVAWASTLPLGSSTAGQSFVEIVGDPPPASGQLPAADYQIVSPAFFRTLDLPVVAGRGFTDRDTRNSVPVCIVNEAFVRAHLRGRPPIGARVAIRFTVEGRPDVREVVGVARQVKGRPDEVEDFVQIYVPLAQDAMDDMYLLVRPASGRADVLASPVRAAIALVDKEQLVSVRDIMTLGDVAREATARHRFRAVLVVAFAGLALALGMVGLFGILAYSVQQRMRDLGVRRALGASTGDVLRSVVRGALPVIACGIGVGLLVSAFLGRLLAAMLFGVQPRDPMSFAIVPAVLVLTAAVAVAGPAWRATRIDPAVALRGE
jgi:putative ABC transport system permease protein